MAAAALNDLSDALRQVAQRAGPAVVGLGRGWGVGSGFVLEPGRAVVSAHSLRRDEPSTTTERAAKGRKPESMTPISANGEAVSV